MRMAIVPSSDLDASDLRAKRFLPDPDLKDTHLFTNIVTDEFDLKWEWCRRCGTLRFNGEYIAPGPRQGDTVRGSRTAKRCPASKTPTWRRSGDYHYYGGWTVIGPRDGFYTIATRSEKFTKLKDAKAFVEGGCRRSSLRKNR